MLAILPWLIYHHRRVQFVDVRTNDIVESRVLLRQHSLDGVRKNALNVRPLQDA